RHPSRCIQYWKHSEAKMARSALIAALVLGAAFIATPNPSAAMPIAPAIAVGNATSELGGIENVRWVRRCHTESRLRWTYYGQQWVPVRVCRRAWEPNYYQPYYGDRGREYYRDYRDDYGYGNRYY